MWLLLWEMFMFEWYSLWQIFVVVIMAMFCWWSFIIFSLWCKCSAVYISCLCWYNVCFNSDAAIFTGWVNFVLARGFILVYIRNTCFFDVLQFNGWNAFEFLMCSKHSLFWWFAYSRLVFQLRVLTLGVVESLVRWFYAPKVAHARERFFVAETPEGVLFTTR